MKIVVCVSLVPDSTTKVKISEGNKSIDDTGVTYILNPYDEFAVEEAVQVKEKKGAETYAISFGTLKHKEAVKKAFQMGIDKGILIQAESDEYDSYTAAKNLAEAIREINPDIVFFGKQSIDFDGLTVPGMVGELLGIPSVNVVTKIEYGESSLILEREIEGGKEVISTAMPVVIGTQKGLNTPRYPNLKSIMASKSKPIEEKKAFYSGNMITVKEMKLPESKGKGKIFTDGIHSVPELVNLLRNEAKVI
jgi:electron transfer flavoprotein beta subunit